MVIFKFQVPPHAVKALTDEQLEELQLTFAATLTEMFSGAGVIMTTSGLKCELCNRALAEDQLGQASCNDCTEDLVNAR